MREIVRARHVLLEFNGRDVLNISELSVAENERIGFIGASGSGAPRPLQKPHRGFFALRTIRRADAVRIHLPDAFSPVAKQKPQRTCIR